MGIGVRLIQLPEQALRFKRRAAVPPIQGDIADNAPCFEIMKVAGVGLVLAAFPTREIESLFADDIADWPTVLGADD